MHRDEFPRHLGEEDELPEDFGTRPGDTLAFGSGSYVRTLSAEEARRFMQQPHAAAPGRGPEATGPADRVMENRSTPRGLKRLLPAGWRRAAHEQVAAFEPPPPPVVVAPPARLTVELVPKTSWYNNVRALVDAPTWDRIRRQVYRQARYRCELCGGRGPEHPVECHEVWRYEDPTRMQKLVRMIALCPACHQVKHYGLANLRGKGAQARVHLMRVNGWTARQADTYIEAVFRVWERRSQGPWTLDLNGLAPYVPDLELQAIQRRAARPPR
ncbi:MAG TPA: HNH endonuclease signature motif containing protein [Actinomycetes bacterium]|jgi:hypothetical protein|nr:HNH endonuclease signature motif containing protein [Actinomycetes bacterium]